MKIKKVIINNFRAFKHEEFEFGDFNCIIGKNDSGKSTILAALEWFFDFDLKKKLNENDFAAMGIDWTDKYDTSYDPITGEEHIETIKEYIYDDCISVEVYFCDIDIPNISEQYDLIFDKDFLTEEGDVCICKYMYHPYAEHYNKQQGYHIKKHFFEEIGEIFSDCSFEELKAEFNKIGKNADQLCVKLDSLKEEYKNKEGLAAVSVFSDIQKEETTIKQRIISELYKHYNSAGYEIKSGWMDFVISDEHPFPFDLDFPKYTIYTSKATLQDYLNELFTPDNVKKTYEKIEYLKKETAKKLSELLSLNGNRETLDIKKNERVNLFTENSLIFKTNDLPLNIPLTNRGEGTQLKIKNAVFRLLTEIQSKNRDYRVFAFEEPETHLHPSAQIEMYETIKKLSGNTNYQIIITTHSPYIVKELAKDKKNKILVVKRNEQNNESHISKLKEQVLAHDDYVSMNEINYIAFDEPTIEYHQELFAFLQGGEKTVDGVDKMFEQKNDWHKIGKKGELVMVNGSPKEIEYHSLPYCVRNHIDHPNKENKKYSDRDIRKESIEIMRNAIISCFKK